MPKTTIYQRLSSLFGNSTAEQSKNTNSYNLNKDDILFRTKDKEEYEAKLLQLKQQKLLANQWRRAKTDIANRSLVGLTEVKLMYRDADLMDTFPEIGAALDVVSEEACYIKNEGFMVSVSSKSERVKSVLQDLLVNRLVINTTLPMICRAMCKYGNQFMLLNIEEGNGIVGWKQLPVNEIERYENGMQFPYSNAVAANYNNLKDSNSGTKFVWVGQSEYIPYMNWQIAHFRLLYDSLLLPYGVSFLFKARRHFRMLSMMEDAMLIYRLERSIERRVFKINVGAIDEADVPAFVDEIANNFKRTPIIDPQTGQVDLRKNLLGVSDDYFIPVRDDSAPSPIETLPGAQNLTAMDDIKYVQNKVCTALRVPKSFLNFEEEKGDGKNLSLLDVRFTRTVNRIQQALLMELNKVCIIHLYLLGFTDDLTNFSLTMNNPSSQSEMLELENISKKITTAKDAMTDGGSGIPLMSATRVWKDIMGWSEKEIENNLEELRLERALAAELERTGEIIKRTHVFDSVDNVYGEPGAEYAEGQQQGEGPDEGGGFGGGGGGFGGFGGASDMDFGGEDLGGAEGEMPMDNAASEDAAMGGGGADMGATPAEGGEPQQSPIGETTMLKRLMKKVLNEQKQLETKRIKYSQILSERRKNSEKKENENIPLYDKNFLINEELNNISKELSKLSKNDEK